MNNRFKLEQEILSTWNLVDMLDLVAERVQDNDEVSNLVLGIKHLMHASFEKTFSTFEALLKEEYQAKQGKQTSTSFKMPNPFGDFSKSGYMKNSTDNYHPSEPYI
jgi:hypothetical protein